MGQKISTNITPDEICEIIREKEPKWFCHKVTSLKGQDIWVFGRKENVKYDGTIPVAVIEESDWPYKGVALGQLNRTNGKIGGHHYYYLYGCPINSNEKMIKGSLLNIEKFCEAYPTTLEIESDGMIWKKKSKGYQPQFNYHWLDLLKDVSKEYDNRAKEKKK